MARFTFRLPDIGEGISEAEIVAWHVKLGDRVEEDQSVADMMTDKATVEMESPVSGTVVELAGEVGDQVPIGSALMVIETDAVEEAVSPATQEAVLEAENPGVEEAQTPSPPMGEGGGEGAPQATSPVVTPHPDPLPQGEREQEKKVLASPAVRARAQDLGVDLSAVKPAEGDRVRHSDLDAFLRYGSGQGYTPARAPRADQQVRVIGMRRRIAENMAASKRAIPHFTYVEEIDVTALEETRAQLNAGRGNRPKLTMLPLLIVAICKTLPDFPMLNARYDDEAGVVNRSGAVHMGMATQTPAGLMVPVIRNAESRNVWQLATEIGRLAEAARAGSIASADMGGGTITLTSLGPLGGIATTPVINRPEVAIIGPNRIVERPVFRSDGRGGETIARAKLMNLSISCDHRVVDGYDAASYVQALKNLLETPVMLFAD
ncbi:MULTISPECIES: dihydrolipoamide acetyltransferase family protein [Sphingomonas]|jgi:2-oxoisovalerate dehydrogenase E2 component (dihydrolipoyl transacylase)|uniref:Dihydrolipoamide acetyltransferase component of pyruvate dehydrogenase complex n=1 Tax=Sphingomonas zeae TaxID=1646122 RepID=A0A7Y6B190_9SPHN|nr:MULTISPECIES: dihydrolipoamide acetyltransferase family protein [Sphingomonas]MBB4050110.1 2-oxoisovalerate dehydrogenase E2 component (dihydrolipoyl transacylase) [Sphingomonas zeae]MDK8188209.1 dihydrolipoamide acetyltransferase family protein [Sphingomonas zeae]MDK8218064.1 dihydrolipoamide acetyltransferase family protein [Sphingomonas sp. UMB7805-LC452B]NUU45579.1 2-oxo acid dehydrogenase subunit E2 [Sphingomonas zeae]